MTTKKSQKRGHSPHEKRAAKKAAVLGTEKKSRLPLITILSCTLLVIVTGLFFLTQAGKGPSATVSGNQITFPVDLFEDGKARHFQYKTRDGITIKYFILRSSDGVIRAAFDACDVCWPAGKGYYQSGDVMVCQNCGRRFASVNVNVIKGGCNPAPLAREVVDGRLVIKVKNILEGRQYFDFSRRS